LCYNSPRGDPHEQASAYSSLGSGSPGLRHPLLNGFKAPQPRGGEPAYRQAGKELLSTGYPFTLVIGTAWVYIAPIIIIGILLAVSFKGHGK